MIEKSIPQLAAAQPLTDEQVRLAVEQLAGEKVSANIKADFLTALALKGETPGEIAAFARALRDKSIPLPLDAETRARQILDVVGTGGDRLGTINISTAAALICAAAGVTVAKHGNRAVTSQAGSADVLEALGVRIDLTPQEAARSLREHNFAFFFAPDYHPAFKNISPARKICAERGQRTIFNLLGPLLNPARPSAMLMGVPRPELCEPLAHVLQSLGVRRAMVVSGKVSGIGYLDELSTLGENTIAEFYQERGFTVSTTLPEQFSLQHATLADLLGGDRDVNAGIVRRILCGNERGPKRDAVLINAAAALFVAGRTKSLIEGWDLAGETIDGGHAKAKLAELSR
ncbi:MAG TPA: anthranilate phosphoribosyltransferase [Candidatus Dormibacteraeota bacterium]|nr:anthranilate phosphoribosyltransferase [Candidatus Dormibacteraeota bacterium]